MDDQLPRAPIGYSLGLPRGGTSPLLMAGHRRIISRISSPKGSQTQNIFIYNFIITTFDCQGGNQGGGISARATPWCTGAATGPTCTLRMNSALPINNYLCQYTETDWVLKLARGILQRVT